MLAALWSWVTCVICHHTDEISFSSCHNVASSPQSFYKSCGVRWTHTATPFAHFGSANNQQKRDFNLLFLLQLYQVCIWVSSSGLCLEGISFGWILLKSAWVCNEILIVGADVSASASCVTAVDASLPSMYLYFALIGPSDNCEFWGNALCFQIGLWCCRTLCPEFRYVSYPHAQRICTLKRDH